ncbi:delta-1-pyrroline-5-carboxylate dehydrogenase, mitochondrial [Blastomyces dermatitidis ER-3]|uniref:Multifunctional fusion protein n=1 Tax=Ajellomyces dermatitidis (strain ER-3 / ATCC MYA-2586) TaxID=559297 RepID=A0ABP2EZ47_AJEDR|nr:delta-1-pyrroline-5-carboxylate dehydrogenase, mitochondrial [Blastomyces dermatitidis ER-3]EEQ89555.1 delta-1-pyrroline-5-carboxylate dehydrogenase, mitochondrial [Blastomyces dermatitidis ER-3]
MHRLPTLSSISAKQTIPIASTTRLARSFGGFAGFKVPRARNEPNPDYGKNSPERLGLENALKSMKQKLPLEVPAVIAGKNIKPSKPSRQPNPSAHAEAVAEYYNVSEENVTQAIEAALKNKPEWERLSFADRASVFLKAADLVAGKYRYDIMAATMLGQGKNAWQAEIDAAAELADFLRFNVQYAEELYAQQPQHHANGVWNRVEYRPLEGFVYALSPFNFTAIGGNLCGAPALLGNVIVWKPSPSSMAASYLMYQIFLEAGLPPNVIQFVPGDAEMVTKVALGHKEFAALHFTGSTTVFRSLYGKIAQGIANGIYRSYPRAVGETGGKNFHLIHPSADIKNAAIHTVRGAFEYQGQKCSATSRAYVPQSRWQEFKSVLVSETTGLKSGPPEDFGNFMGPVIHEASFKKLAGVIDAANNDSGLELIVGGKYDGSKGYFIQPTIYVTKDPHHKLMSTELFGPVLAVYVYDDTKAEAFEKICQTINGTSEYGLTGSIFAVRRDVIRYAEEALRNTAGNFYINCKSTGAVVGQQPFGGARQSGTNDKAGSAAILSRFVSMRSIKEEFSPLSQTIYPSNEV